ncbi:MAG: hypothetical protein L0Z62_01585 [Gemmataceae bacterium]|nr:hypothetical protein [Gemmataceae bacterium]
MSEPDALPNEKQRCCLCEMMAAAFIEIRMLGWGGHAQQAADLADAFHNLPREMYAWGVWRWDDLRRNLEDYQRRYNCSRDYVRMLDEIKGLA